MHFYNILTVGQFSRKLSHMCIECLSVAVCTRALHQFLPYYIGVVGRMARSTISHARDF